MKASDNFKIDQAWWKKNKPLTLKTTGLGAVMKQYQDAKVKIQELAKKGAFSGEFNSSVTPFDAARKVLEKNIPVAVAKAKGMCNKTLHKDTIVVLDKYKSAVSAEGGVLTSMEDNFNKTYKAKHFDPMRLQAEQIETKMTQDKETAQGIYKDTEAAFKRVGSQLTYLKSLEKQKKLREEDVLAAAKDSKDDMTKIKKNCEALVKMVSSGENDVKTVDRLLKSSAGILSFRDQDVIKNHLNSVMKYKNLILDYSSRAAMFQTGALSSLNEFKSALTGAQTSAAQHLKELAALQATMTGNEGATRKLENTFTNLILLPSKMIAAVKKAPDRGSIEVPAGVDVPVAKWESRIREWIETANLAIKKTTKILDQSKEMKDKVFAKIDKSILESDQAKPIVKDIEAKLGGIETYQKNCHSDLKTLQDKLNLLTSELAKKK